MVFISRFEWELGSMGALSFVSFSVGLNDLLLNFGWTAIGWTDLYCWRGEWLVEFSSRGSVCLMTTTCS